MLVAMGGSRGELVVLVAGPKQDCSFFALARSRASPRIMGPGT